MADTPLPKGNPRDPMYNPPDSPEEILRKKQSEEAVHRQARDTMTAPMAFMPPHDIGWAVKQMWNGQAVRRRGWNGRGMLLRIQVPDANSQNTLPYVWMKTAQGGRVPWLCSQTDLLALDWELVEV